MPSFDPRKYSVIYEEMIESKEARDCFRKYLADTSFSDETILFLDELEYYKKEYDKSITEIMEILKVESELNTTSENSLLETAHPTFKKKSQLKKVTKQLRIISDKCNSIFNIYIRPSSEKELNIGHIQKDLLVNHEKIKEKFEHFTKLTLDSSISKSTSTLSIDDMESTNNSQEGSLDSNESNLYPLCSEIIELLDYQKLFNEVELSVHMDLKMDQFPRFVRSQFLLNFLKEKGENFTRTIAIDTSKGVNVDLRFKPNDLMDKTVSDNHIYFGFTLAEDTPDWKLIQDKKLYQSYCSKTPYVFSSSRLKGMQLFKSVMYLPFSFEDVWAMWVHGDNHVKFDPQAHSDYKLQKYVPPCEEGLKENTVDQPKYALQLLTSGLDYKLPFVKKRYFCMTGTTIKDPFNDMYMYVMHTGDFSQEELPRQENGINALGLSYYIFYKMSDTMTRVVHVLYGDANFKYNSNLILELFWKKRTKDIYNRMVKLLEELTENRSRKLQVSDSVDDQYYEKAWQDNQRMYPNRSWYLEWSKSNRDKRKSTIMHKK